MRKTRPGKKAESHDFPIILILVIVVAIVLFIVFFPMIKEWFTDFLIILGVSEEKDTYIRSFEVEQGLEGALVFTFRFLNDQAISGYELKSTTVTGETKMGVIPIIDKERVSGILFDEKMKKEYLVNSKEIIYRLPAPSALEEKKYTLYALDSSGKVLQEKNVEWSGVFDDQEKYRSQIETFMDFAGGLKGLASEKQATIRFSEGVALVGFSADFNSGSCGYQKFNWASGVFGCKHIDIELPKECAEVKSCICLCRRVGDVRDYCGNTGRICYGYDEFEFIGGSRRTCGLEGGLFGGKKQGEDGEDNEPVTIWKGIGFNDPNEEFNSLAIVSNEDGERQLALKLSPGTKSFVSEGANIHVKSLVISK